MKSDMQARDDMDTEKECIEIGWNVLPNYI